MVCGELGDHEELLLGNSNFLSLAAESLNLLPVVGEYLHSFPTSEAEYKRYLPSPLASRHSTYSKFCRSDTSSQGFELG